jgi:hypothetical protein
MEATTLPTEAVPSAIERATKRPNHDGIFVPLRSWWTSQDGSRLFVVTGLGGYVPNEGWSTRYVLERGKSEETERPMSELKRLIKEGYWLPYAEEPR